MKRIAVIPARYGSSRVPGKPLVDICGKPMIWWVYQQTMEAKGLNEIVVATDHNEIVNACNKYNMNVIKTDPNHESHVLRIFEVARKISADLYVCVCGDEPIIEPKVIETAIPDIDIDANKIYVSGVRRILTDPVETIDSGNIKIVVDKDEYALALSRTPIPYPYKTIEYSYYKTIGIECFNRKALEYYAHSKKGAWEKAEDIMMLRFVENHIKVKFPLVKSKSLSVDTAKDLERVRRLIEEKGHVI